MNFFLVHLKLNGIKNISHEVELDFYNKILTKFNPEMNRVKAIYGENGSGKTAIMTAVNIAKKIVLNPGYLKQVDTQSFFQEIINKVNKKLIMEFEFVTYREKEVNLYRYGMCLSQNLYGEYELKNEKLDVIKNYTKNKKYIPVFEVEDGQIKYIAIDSERRTELERITMNTLQETPLAFRFLTEKSEFNGTSLDVISVVLFFFSITVYLDEEDMHEIYLINRIVENLKNNPMNSESRELYSVLGKQLFYIDSKGRDIVDKKDFAEYKKKIARLEKFIKIFKADLHSIKIEKRDDGDSYKCELIFNYGKYTVNREFESTGIKKLIRIFDVLSNADEGNISFVDEMDSNINDVYLCKIIEYFVNYSKGQLCFTTHNLDPMSILKYSKNSIDFLSADNKIVSWKVTGNAAPERFYRNGMIENSPFNIDAIDFIGIFGE